MPNPSKTEIVTIFFDGREINVESGSTIAAALIAEARAQGRTREPCGFFCGMGVCHDCLVILGGRITVRACMTKVMNDMRVESCPRKTPLVSASQGLARVPDGSLPEEEFDALVVGAGPGGLHAAIAASQQAVSVLIVDERPAPGGQYYKQPATTSALAPNGSDRQARDGAALIKLARAQGIEIRAETLIWGAFRENGRVVLGAMSDSCTYYVRARIVIVATGAFEQPPVFRGWTLPGVMTTGACQSLLRCYGVRAGRRVLVAGNGPLNFQVAAELARAGVQVVGVAEKASAPWTRLGQSMALATADPQLALAGARMLTALRIRRIPVYWDHQILRVDGRRHAESAVLTHRSGSEIRVSVDTVCVNEGFVAANELARLLGCRHTIRRDGLTRLETRRDDAGSTSVSDVLVVGEAGGFAGAHVAMAQGHLAGLEAARRIGRQVLDDLISRRVLRRHRRFQQVLWRVFAASEAGLSRATEETLVCRCESLSLGQIQGAIARHDIADLATLKRLTRAGMGRCQGRYCWARLAELVGPVETELDVPAPQIPLRPIPLISLAGEKPEWRGHKRTILPPHGRTPLRDPIPAKKTDVLVIGAGIAGLSTALFLARGGVEVVVVDRTYPNAGASGGNAGSLHGQLLSFDGGTDAEGGGSPAAITLPLQSDSIALWQQLERETGCDMEIGVTGGLMVAETERDLAFLSKKIRIERQYGIRCELIDKADLRKLEPALDQRFIGAAYCPAEGKINPLIASQAILDAARALGVRVFAETGVTGIVPENRAFVVQTTRGFVRAGRVVNAAGALASQIGLMVGRRIPVCGAPLQMIVTEAVPPLISKLIAHADRHLTLKQAGNGNFVIGGGWTAGVDPIHHHPRPLRRSLEGNLWIAQHVVPDLRRLNIIRSWAAMNIDIDGAPLLGEDPDICGFFNVVSANGYTLGPLIGRITADLILRGTTDRDIEPFSLSRFRN
jgi:glycine/D-amino acid oxidase-like deaminating enzyme